MSGADFTVAILIGGDSSRMGSDKATFEVDGLPMATRVAQAAKAAGAAEILLVGSTQAKAKKLSGTWKKDSFPGEGPLGGVITALKSASHDSVVVLSCDMPFITDAVITSLVRGLNDAQASVGRTDRLNWLCAAWSKEECLQSLQGVWKRNERAVHRAAVLLDVAEVPVPAVAVRNINTPADLLAPDDSTTLK
ncbi:MAG: molybdenum cofactor guanylyltransferase [Acidimicrobiaceae bacterium]|jgi:molybdopterin-guanine dinucleotide biosynthesis protein A|nr:molybdenum cofactor guanylyltransferase [Ilumatobacteraceae bacterium]